MGTWIPLCLSSLRAQLLWYLVGRTTHGHIRNVFRAFFRRALTHCSNAVFLNTELKRIYQCGAKHGYSFAFMRKIFQEQKRKFETEQYASNVSPHRSPLCTPTNENTRISLPYKVHKYKTINQALSKAGTKCTYKRVPTIFNLLRNDKKKRNPKLDSRISQSTNR